MMISSNFPHNKDGWCASCVFNFRDRVVDSMQGEVDNLRKENDILRAIAAKIMPCHYCGVDSIAKCPRGFPGCALADDLFGGEETKSDCIIDLRKRVKELEELTSKLTDSDMPDLPIAPTSEENVVIEPVTVDTVSPIDDDDMFGDTKLGPPAASCDIGCESCQ